MKKLFALAIIASVFLSGCSGGQDYGAQPPSPQTGTQQPNQPAPAYPAVVVQPTVESAKLRYEIIDDTKKTVFFMEDDGSVTITSKQLSSSVQEMESDKINIDEVKEMALELKEKNFFSMPAHFGDFGENGDTIVFEASIDGQTKNIACKKTCPKDLENVINRIETIIANHE